MGLSYGNVVISVENNWSYIEIKSEEGLGADGFECRVKNLFLKDAALDNALAGEKDPSKLLTEHQMSLIEQAALIRKLTPEKEWVSKQGKEMVSNWRYVFAAPGAEDEAGWFTRLATDVTATQVSTAEDPFTA